MTNIYVVRLTEPAHNWLVGLTADVDTSWMSPGNQDIAREASNALESARPEHSERRKLLDELWEACKDWREERAAEMRVLDVLAKLRSLEGK